MLINTDFLLIQNVYAFLGDTLYLFFPMSLLFYILKKQTKSGWTVIVEDETILNL